MVGALAAKIIDDTVGDLAQMDESALPLPVGVADDPLADQFDKRWPVHWPEMGVTQMCKPHEPASNTLRT